MPSKGKRQIKSYPTPLVTDILFFEVWDISREGAGQLNYDDPHPDKDKWPYHRIVAFQPVADQGENIYAVFFAADRKHQDRYNFEHRKADLGGNKFDVVVRSYVTRRRDYNPNSPALGSVMPDVPTGKFADSAGAMQYTLIAKSQDRISQRSARAEATIGQAELDNVYVVELHTYMDRAPITTVTSDDTIGGLPLYTTSTIYVRGESYSNSLEGASVPIEEAVANSSYWGVTDTGKKISFQQVSEDVWVEVVQDLIPQSGLPGDAAKFGGTVIRVYQTTASYAWPAVLGSDGVPEFKGSAPVEIMNWVYKNGGARNHPRPRYKRNAKRMKTVAIVHQEWLTQDELTVAESNNDFFVIDDLDPDGIYYPSPYLTVNLPPSLHRGGAFICDTGTNDPTWGQNVGSTRTYPATDLVDWPESVVADVDVQPFRGGFLVTHVTIYNPSVTTSTT